MGTISLLTRKGEVEIAKRIEAGQNEVLAAVASCAVTTREIVAMANYVKKGEIPRVLGGLGIALISTSQGVMSDKEAWKRKIGGEILGYVW